MNGFEYKGHELFVEDVPVRKIVSSVDSPVYIYSEKALREAYSSYQEAFQSHRTMIAYAMKANGNLQILSMLGKMGSGADVVSGGELFRARRAGIPSDRIVFAGVGKTEGEMREAIDAGILMFNVESSMELDRLSRVASSMGKVAPVALRVNPDVDPKTHPYISTGMKKSKFGIPVDQALEEYRRAARLPGIRIVGIHQHIGSQLTEISPFRDAFDRMVAFARLLKENGIEVSWLDVGGGLGIRYGNEKPPTPREVAHEILSRLEGLNVGIILEPGRSIVGNAGILVTEVQYLKETSVKMFYIADAGMNDLIRPSLYGAFHDLWPVIKKPGNGKKGDLVGPVCETGDFLVQDRELPPVEPGDLLAVMSAGAYGFAMASNYNARPRPAEVLVSGDRFSVIRARETYEDLIRGEGIV
ncbi:diaminopimelate decarboxylase [Leptospirillum ferriphilum]|uniref:Diaminopimelate decarboxylase n=2 Tax=Leptospirillum TaxID=179 RepID=A0A094WAS1_9BACT|nr:diaminopimelate decarboxylase [Leptospirillum ferriphilum]EDZ40011.1 MAG: Diaminopimelate decarboxylase [Leptospirillum sp. Group II '5-way CG']KGA94638.1 Diaminopimelate decarboxylase [Leptospirillum ferriphilum]